jgi:AAA domain
VTQDLFAWTEKQADWARDALRRHAFAPNFELGADDKAQVLRRVRQAAGIADEDVCENVPFAAEHFKSSASAGTRTLLVSLGPVKNLARLAPDQRLSFALDGITLIYGDNGSGKTGYCRITKKVCRSLTADDLLGDVFKEGAKPPAEVVIRYRQDGENDVTERLWTDGTPSPAAIAGISVFDARNARLFVDAENRIGFLPREVALLEQHAKHCGEMDAKIDGEVKALNARLKIALPAGYAVDGDAAKLFARLAPKQTLPTEAEIRAAAVWTEKDQKDLEDLERLLAQDPKALADRYRRAASLLKGYSTDAKAIVEGLSAESAVKLAEAHAQAKSTAAAAALAASDRFKAEPLAGTGFQPWRLMYDYAEKYVQSLGSDGLSAKEGDPCALCQEPLSADGAARMQRFADFVNDQASKAADAAAAALAAKITTLKGVIIPKRKDVENALADYRKISDDTEQLSATIIVYFSAAETRRKALLDATETAAFDAIKSLADPIDKKLDGETAALEDDAAKLDKAAASGGAQRLQERERLAKLKDRKKLADDLETVLSRLKDLEMAGRLAKCRELLSTKTISVQITTLRRDLVTTDLEKRIMEEVKTLDLLHLPFRVTDRSDGGKSNFKVVLATPVGVANDKVLSEGEQRALALACFLGELGGDTVKHGIVIDDPVSSLDHIRIRRVAQRIVEEAAKEKQIIIFTHNLLFYNEVSDAAARAHPQIPVAKRIVTKSAEVGFGVIANDDEPWIAQAVKDRLNRLHETLKAMEARTDVETDAYRRAVKDFYTDLRETWERFVEEVLLGKTVERFNTDVKTQSLKGVVVEDDDYRKIFWAMRRVSEHSGHDMAAGINLPLPKIDDMKTDLKEFEDYQGAVRKRKKGTEEARKKLEDPPKAETL